MRDWLFLLATIAAVFYFLIYRDQFGAFVARAEQFIRWVNTKMWRLPYSTTQTKRQAFSRPSRSPCSVEFRLRHRSPIERLAANQKCFRR
jgi:hypothetical protein